MAKPHRMFWMTVAALVAATVPLWIGSPYSSFATDGRALASGEIIRAALWLVVIGATFTALNRARRALVYLNKK
jgi:hypothetical protein